MKVFKFGGASVKDAESVQNVSKIIAQFGQNEVLIVVSAMGKMTNLLEKIIHSVYQKNKIPSLEFENFIGFHVQIIEELNIELDLSSDIQKFIQTVNLVRDKGYSFIYDQLIGFGELFSSKILFSFLQTQNNNVQFLNVGSVIKTNSNYQNALVDWEVTELLISKLELDNKITVTQGFVAQDNEGHSTSLGREGSDFSAAIFASVLKVSQMTIWKDVDGFFNADPRLFPEAQKYEHISFREAIELAYYGASVVHPKTIQPLQRKNINLFVKSFVQPEKSGTLISSQSQLEPNLPSVIVKKDLFLLSLSTQDLSFIMEKELESIFGLCKHQGVRVILMQNSATSCSLVLQNDRVKIPLLLEDIKSLFNIKYNENVELFTIRHYNTSIVDAIYKKGRFILEERNNKTIQILVQSKE